MRWPRTPLRLAAAAFGIPLLLTSCQDRGERLEAELGDAGYTLTEEDWFRAAAADDVAAMERFLDSGFSLDALDDAGDAALHHAAAAGARGTAAFLLRRGMDIDLRGAAGRTPLMNAAAANQTSMTGWLLRQGADPQRQDDDGFRPLMLAISHGSHEAIGEIAPYHREDLDKALLLASMLGNAAAIDTLTNFGASVYARMEDGRTPLMMAAQNGHADAIAILVEIGASRFATDEEGHSAADHARNAGHEELVALILPEPAPEELRLESREEIGADMAAFVETARGGSRLQLTPDTAAAPSATAGAATGVRRPGAPPDIDGRRLGQAATTTAAATTDAHSPSAADPARHATAAPPEPSPPLIMRHFRARELPLEVGGIRDQSVSIRLRGDRSSSVDVSRGETIPGTRLVVREFHRRMETSKMNPDQATEVSIVEVEDAATGERRHWRSGLPASGHDPIALVEDAATGDHYLASPGQKFFGADGIEYTIVDVRPAQLVVEDASGSVQTLALRGPRG